MNVSTSATAAQKQQQADSNDLYLSNTNSLLNYNQANTLVSPLNLLQQQMQQQHHSVDNANLIFENNENDNNNNLYNNNNQLINDLKQQQQQQSQNIQQLSFNLTQQSSQFQITSILDQGQEQTDFNNQNIHQFQQPQQILQQTQQQPAKDSKESRFRIVKTDSEKTDKTAVGLNGSVAVGDSNASNEVNGDENGINNGGQFQQIAVNRNQLNGLNGTSSSNSYHRGRWHVMDVDTTHAIDQQINLQSINNISQIPTNGLAQLITPPVFNSNVLNNTSNSNSPALIASTNLSCALSEEPTSLYSNKQKEQMFSNVNIENSIELHNQAPAILTTTTLPQNHFNPINPTNNIDSNGYYATQTAYTNTQPQIVQPIASTATNSQSAVSSSTNITIKPVPIVSIMNNSNNIPNLQQIVLINSSSAGQSVKSVSSPIVTDPTIQNTVNTLVGQVSSSPSLNSSGPSTASSTISSNAANNNVASMPSTMISNLNEKLQTNMEKIHQTQSSIGQVGLLSNQIKPSTNQIFSNNNNNNNNQQQKESNAETVNTNPNETTYSQNKILNLNDQLTSNLSNSSLASNSSNQNNQSLHYQPLQVPQQQPPTPVFDILNVNVSNNNSSSSNSDYNQSSPKEQLQQQQQQQQQHHASNTVQMVNNTLSNQSSSSITGNNTPPLTNLTQPSTNLASSSSSTIIDQTTATLNLLMSDPDSSISDSDKKSLDNDKGIKSRIELAMDLVKTHLTSAVNQEIVLLKSQIKQLTEKCSRLEQENQILKKHALPETLALIENRGSALMTSQGSSNSLNSNSNNNNNNLQTGNNVLSATSTSQISDGHNQANNNETAKSSLLLTTAVDKLQDCMTTSMTEHILNNNSNNDPFSNVLIATNSNILYNEPDSLTNQNIHNTDESIMNINETMTK